LAEALRLHAAGWMISLAGPVTYKNAARNREVAAGLPLEALVLETDAPYLAPAPRRGERNEPAFVRHTAEFVAGLRGLDLAELAAATTANAVRLFAGGLADGLAATSMTTAAPAARELA
ncbi:MAG TPA: TatD family hydrolase, partial [Anaerolineae bacterium]|nr:TatD family hydrolase [Anaerolineae bacterium]